MDMPSAGDGESVDGPFSWVRRLLDDAENVNAYLWRLVAAESTVGIQLSLVAIHGVFWYFFVREVSTKWLGPYLKRQYYVQFFTTCSQATFRNGYYLDLDREQAFDLTVHIGAVLVQHLVGGALCVPAMIFANPWATALAIHGALCEAGWEASDIVMRTWQLLFGGREGRRKNPRNLVLILFGHHLMGQLMVVPMNLYHRDDRDYHELVLELQFAAFFAGFAQLSGYTLRLGVPSDFRLMRFSVTLTLALVLWSRGLRYVVVGSRLIAKLRAADEPRMLACGAFVLLVMAVFNVFVVIDCWKKFVKFNFKSHVPGTCACHPLVDGLFVPPAAKEPAPPRDRRRRNRAYALRSPPPGAQPPADGRFGAVRRRAGRTT